MDGNLKSRVAKLLNVEESKIGAAIDEVGAAINQVSATVSAKAGEISGKVNKLVEEQKQNAKAQIKKEARKRVEQAVQNTAAKVQNTATNVKDRVMKVDGVETIVEGASDLLKRTQRRFKNAYSGPPPKSGDEFEEIPTKEEEPEGDAFGDMAKITNGLFDLAIGLTAGAAKVATKLAKNGAKFATYVAEDAQEVAKDFVGELKGFFAEVQEFFGETKGTVEDCVDSFNMSDLKAQIAKLGLAKRMYQAAMKAGFSEEQAKELANRYFYGETRLDWLKNQLPDEYSLEVVEFFVGLLSKPRTPSKEKLISSAWANENPAFRESVLRSIRISRSDWYNTRTDEALEKCFKKLYAAYAATLESGRSPSESLDQQVKTLLRSELK